MDGYDYYFCRTSLVARERVMIMFRGRCCLEEECRSLNIDWFDVAVIDIDLSCTDIVVIVMTYNVAIVKYGSVTRRGGD